MNKKRFTTTLPQTYEKKYAKIITDYAVKPIIDEAKAIAKDTRFKSALIHDGIWEDILKRIKQAYKIFKLEFNPFIHKSSSLSELVYLAMSQTRKKWERNVTPIIGYMPKVGEDLENLIYEWLLNQVELIDKLGVDMQGRVLQILQDAFYNGSTVKDISEKLNGALHYGKYRSETIAITEMARINERYNRQIMKESGITKVRWSTARDDRVRPCHKARENKVFELNKGCFSTCDGKHLRPGQEVRCRCAYLIEITEEMLK